MWVFEHTEITTAPPEAIWKRWSNVQLWAEQNKDVEWAKLEGTFIVGSKILIKPKGSPQTSTVITQVTDNKSFTSESKIPFGILRFEHDMKPEKNKKGQFEFLHRVTITGPLTFIFRKLFGEKMAKNLPEMMQQLASLAEKS